MPGQRLAGHSLGVTDIRSSDKRYLAGLAVPGVKGACAAEHRGDGRRPWMPGAALRRAGAQVLATGEHGSTADRALKRFPQLPAHLIMTPISCHRAVPSFPATTPAEALSEVRAGSTWQPASACDGLLASVGTLASD